MRVLRPTLVGLLAAGAVACGGSPAPRHSGTAASASPSASPAPSVALPADYLGVAEAPPVPPLGPKDPDGYLQGAGWALQATGVDAGPTTRIYGMVDDAKTGAQTVGNHLIGYADLKAAPGQEVVAADLTGAAAKTAGAAGNERPAQVTIRAGAVTHLLKLDRDRRIVVTAAAGAPVTLTVEDGRPQTLDLRTGKRVGTPPDLALFYAPLTQRELEGPLCGFVENPAAGVPVQSKVTAMLLPGTKAHGYAAKGRAMLAVSVTFTTLEAMTMRLDPASFRLTAGGGTLQPRPLDPVTTAAANPGLPFYEGTVRAVFEVPATLRTATLKVAPTGRYTVDGVERATRTYGCRPDTPLSLKLA
ncbi:hypothetical protein KZZ52_29990 [Dactylosporangium sp. AC04546]|uniref:hypothetical protein n=1 Tax=Dactylosporangium sp. AC04546 TaxID=2862460 RepID=UPI001EDD4AA2|nr:hypothetical protein [Dactylosporangium sp. AC04546]WVK78228.1 hypothetical protein KZZ52_29990 [Dactylosporangium sp. AC04546]